MESAAHVRPGRMEKVRGGVNDKIKVSIIAREATKTHDKEWERSGREESWARAAAHSLKHQHDVSDEFQLLSK